VHRRLDETHARLDKLIMMVAEGGKS
jgi:hypothetical protein